MNRIIESVIPLIQADALQRGIAVKVHLAPDIPDLLLHEQEIKQLLLNIARNGMEAMRGQELLTIAPERVNFT